MAKLLAPWRAPVSADVDDTAPNTVPAAVATVPNAFAAGPDLLPLTVTNDSGRAEPVHLYVLGESGGRLGYLAAWSMVSLVVGYRVFKRYEGRLAEEL